MRDTQGTQANQSRMVIQPTNLQLGKKVLQPVPRQTACQRWIAHSRADSVVAHLVADLTA